MSDQPRRLSPEERRDQLLSVARNIVETDGAGACTVDEVSLQAGVTRQLVHKYFGTRSTLLQELFRREDDRYQADVCERVIAADTFEDVVRVFVTANFEWLSTESTIGQLRGVPEVAETMHDRPRSGSRRAEGALVRALKADYPTASPAATEFVLRLGSAASIEAGNLSAQRSKRSSKDDIDNAVRFILAGIHELVGEPNDPSQPRS